MCIYRTKGINKKHDSNSHWGRIILGVRIEVNFFWTIFKVFIFSNKIHCEKNMQTKDGIFQLLLWKLHDMNNFEFWRQFLAFVELIFRREGCVMILQYFCLKFFYLLLTKQNKTAGEISPTLGLWKRAPKFKIVHITKFA